MTSSWRRGQPQRQDPARAIGIDPTAARQDQCSDNRQRSFPHLAAELLKKDSGLDFTIVKHNGEAAVGTSVAGEHTDFAIVTRAVVASFVDAKKLVPIASTGPTRNVLSPDLPTVAEVDLPGICNDGLDCPPGAQGIAANRSLRRFIKPSLTLIPIRRSGSGCLRCSFPPSSTRRRISQRSLTRSARSCRLSFNTQSWRSEAFNSCQRRASPRP